MYKAIYVHNDLNLAGMYSSIDDGLDPTAYGKLSPNTRLLGGAGTGHLVQTKTFLKRARQWIASQKF
jgi:hypothetical protein